MRKLALTLFSLLLLALTACDTADCSLNNTVLCYLSFYNGEGKKVEIIDTLSITAYGTDKVLFNRGTKKSDIAIPLSYYNDEDTLTFTVTAEDGRQQQAEIVIAKSNVTHFESPDCPVNMFHDIQFSYVFSGRFIDSVAVIKPSINYQRDENIRIYLH